MGVAQLSLHARRRGETLDLRVADLRIAENLTQEQLDQACGDANAKPPGGLTLKAMCKQ